jgi:uncharacterized protein YbjT (DUF2867 family)
MKVVVFGATGMVGEAVLLECLEDPEVNRVLAIVRRSTGRQHDKLEEILHRDFTDYTAIRDHFEGLDACFFCLGISSAGMDEDEYRIITYDFAMAAARTLLAANLDLVFCFVSGEGTDSTEEGRVMWARVKGKTENDLLELPFRAAYMFRPGYIHPLKGVAPRERWIRFSYAFIRPIYPVLRRVFSSHVTSTENVGRAMIRAVRNGYGTPILENDDINRLAE